MPRFTVAITDNTFAPIDPEKRIIGAIDGEVRFGHALTEEAVLELAQGCDAIICDGAPITRRVLSALPRVRVVSEYGIGYDNIDVAAATDLGVWVTNVPGFCTNEVAEHTIALMLALLRRLTALDRVVRGGGWGSGAAGPMRRFSTLTHGIIGFGRIGQATARRSAALGFRVVAHSPTSASTRAASLGATAVGLDELLKTADIVSLHCPATDATRGFINARTLALMKPTAYLINVGRGSLVDEAALVAALTSGTIAGAALDVFAPEPPSADNPLFKLDNVLLTPHAAFHSDDSIADLQSSAAENVVAALTGKTPATAVNPAVAARLRRAP
jgi:D-3-phosphoglycerate dehydrogenase